jgi:hypothetical protein
MPAAAVPAATATATVPAATTAAVPTATAATMLRTGGLGQRRNNCKGSSENQCCAQPSAAARGGTGSPDAGGINGAAHCLLPSLWLALLGAFRNMGSANRSRFDFRARPTPNWRVSPLRLARRKFSTRTDGAEGAAQYSRMGSGRYRASLRGCAGRLVDRLGLPFRLGATTVRSREFGRLLFDLIGLEAIRL